MKNKNIVMASQGAKRYDIIKDLISQKINGAQAAKQLNLSVRQIKRLKRRVKKEGIKGIIHKNRGREGNRKLKRKTVKKIKKLIQENYSDFTPAFIQEKLNEEHKIKVSYGAVRNIMIKEKLYIPKKRKNNNYCSQRPRKDYYGEMEQFDGSYHDWLEGRGGIDDLCLLASVDDAKKEITRAEFDYSESVRSVFHFWKEYIEKNGKPIAIYLDKYSTYKINHKNAADNHDLLTQFQRAMKELDIKTISAHSPQAKGRVERLFKTLQDRLVKELRLRKIDNVKEANRFLQEEFIPQFNKKFGVKAKKKGDLHRRLNKREKESLDHIFSVKNQRVVRNDFIVQYRNKYLQLEETQPTTVYKKDKVIIEEHLDDSIHINKKDKYLNFTELKEKPEKEIPVKLPALTLTKTQYTPPANHPWRRFAFSEKLKKQEKIQI